VHGSRNLFQCHPVAERPGLRLAVADDAGGDEVGIVEDGPKAWLRL
jgi:hypothetical protein